MQRWSEQEARELLIAWRKSGLSMERFCRERGFMPERLQRWKQKLDGGRRSAAMSTAPLAFLPVELSTAVHREPVIVLLRSGHVIKVGRAFDEEALARVVAVLGSV